MTHFKLFLPILALIFTASFAHAQNTASPKTQTEPTIYIGDTTLGGRVDRESLLKSPFISVKDSKSGTEWTVVSYTVTFVINGKESPPIPVVGANFTEQIINRIKSAPEGSWIEVTNIKIRSKEGVRTLVAPLIGKI